MCKLNLDYISDLFKDDKKSSVDPSEYKNEDDKQLSDSENSDSQFCDSPVHPHPINHHNNSDQTYAKSNAVKEQIRHKNGKISNKKGKKHLTK